MRSFVKLFGVLKTAADCPQARQQFTDPFQLWRRTHQYPRCSGESLGELHECEAIL